MRRAMDIIQRMTGERPWAGTPAATAPTPTAWWPTTAVLFTTATTTATTCLLDEGAAHRRQRGAPAHRALHAGLQRHALCPAQGYSHADPFFQYLKDTFDALYAEGDPLATTRPR